LPAIELAAPLAMVFLLAAPGARADIKVQPSVNARETYSTNPSLSTDGSNGQFISELSPSLTILDNSPRLQFLGRVTEHLYAYSGKQQPGTNNSNLNVTGNGKGTLVQDLFYVDGNVSRTTQAVSAFGQQYQNGYTSSNSDNITTYSISPYLVHRFGPTAQGQLRYTHDSVKGARAQFGDSTGNALTLNLSSGPSFTRIGWQLQAYQQQLDNEIAGKSKTETALATLRFIARQDLSLYTTGGYDKYDYGPYGGITQGKSYSLGFTWTPSARTNIDASVGHRYFGKTYSLAAVHRSRKTVWTAGYHDDITTTRGQFLRPESVDTATLLDASFASAFPDPIARRQAIDAYIRALGLPTSVANNINYFSNRLFLQKQATASVLLNGSRSTAILSFNNTKRQALSSAVTDQGLASAAIPDLNDNTRQRAITAAFNYRLSGRSSAVLSASKSHVLSLDTGLEQDQTFVNFVLSRQFDRNLSGSVELRRNQGTVFGTDGRGYHENAVSASLSYRLQ